MQQRLFCEGRDNNAYEKNGGKMETKGDEWRGSDKYKYMLSFNNNGTINKQKYKHFLKYIVNKTSTTWKT